MTKKILLLALISCSTLIAQKKSKEISKKSDTKIENMTMKNPLLEKFNTSHETAPFSKIKLEHYKPAFEIAIKETKNEIDAIVNNKQKPTFENTIEALEYSGKRLEVISNIFFNLNSAETSPEMQKLAQELSPMLTKHANDIALNNALFLKIKAVYDQKSSLNLNKEQQKLLDKSYKGFSRNGALLSDLDKEKLRLIDTDLSKIALTFSENNLAENKSFTLHIIDEKDLSGLPDGAKEAAKMDAKNKNLDGWLFTLDYPSYVPFMTYADNRELRKKMSIAFGAKSFRNNEFDNQENVKKLAGLRHQRANLLGYKTHAHFTLEERMSKNPETVQIFLNDLMVKAKPAAQNEFETLSQFAKELHGIEKLEKWDGSYYSEKLKQKLFSFDDEQLKPYFKLENVLEGAFMVSNKLFGLTFKEVKNIETYHKDVVTYEVYDENKKFVAVFYADFFPREGKRNGAWMTSFKSQYKQGKEEQRPHVANVCNFTKPTETKPSLLTFDEVKTLFHEFGHGLHGMLANTTYGSLSGTSVYWDFVELPSQIFENWCYEPEALALFAKHYQTGEVIPQEFINKIKESSSFMEGMTTMRQLSFGMLDMAYHGANPSEISKIKEFELKSMNATTLYPDVSENCMSTSFSHIFAGGYSSGYYSYKWAEVLDADAFEYFKQNGILNKEIGNKFKENILSKGGTEDPMDLYIKFRGKEPTPDALLKRAGLLN
jgi:Zn-dependent oligopeptidase